MAMFLLWRHIGEGAVLRLGSAPVHHTGRGARTELVVLLGAEQIGSELAEQQGAKLEGLLQVRLVQRAVHVERVQLNLQCAGVGGMVHPTEPTAKHVCQSRLDFQTWDSGQTQLDAIVYVELYLCAEGRIPLSPQHFPPTFGPRSDTAGFPFCSCTRLYAVERVHLLPEVGWGILLSPRPNACGTS